MKMSILVERSLIPYLADSMVEDQPLEITLRNIADTYYQFVDTNLPIFRLVIADAYRFPDHAQQIMRIFLEGVKNERQSLSDRN